MHRLLVLSLLAACATTYRYTPTRTAAAKPDDCTFDVLTTRPDGAFEELGAFEATQAVASKIADFKTAVAAQVCRAGGDAVIAVANDQGLYMTGTVLRYTNAPGPAPVAEPAAAPAPSPAPTPASATTTP
jgi:hypothetical protein